MVGLLAPVALWIGLAAAGPILLHFWRREKEQPANLFPGVFFLVDPATPRPQQVKPLTWLLTALRTALILLFALCAAGPYLPVRQALELPEHPVLLGLVIDDSPSMSLPRSAAGGQTRLAYAIERANALMDQLPAGSGVVWTTTSGRFHPLTILPPGGAAARGADHIVCPVSAAAGDLGRALDRIALTEQDIAFPQRQAVLFSDETVGIVGPRTQEHLETAERHLAAGGIACVRVNVLAAAASADAVATPGGGSATRSFVAPRLKIVSLDRPDVWRVGRPVTITARVIFDAAPPADGSASTAAAVDRVADLTWTVGDETIDQPNPAPAQSVDLPCGLRLQSFELVQQFAQAGWWKIGVAAKIDATRQDRRTTYLEVRSATPVWLVEPNDPVGDSRYLELAIDPTRSASDDSSAGDEGATAPAAAGNAAGNAAGEWRLRRKSYADLNGELPQDGVVVLWGAGRGLTSETWEHLAAAVSRGMGLWCVPDGGMLAGRPDNPGAFWFNDVGGAGDSDSDAPAKVGAPRTLANPVPLALIPINGMPENSIRNALEATGAGIFEGAPVLRFYPVQPAGDGAYAVLAVEAGGEELHGALLEAPLGRGLRMLLAVPPVAGNGRLVQSRLWPLLTDLVLERIAPAGGAWPDSEVGEPLAGTLGPGAQPPFRVSLAAPEAALPGHWALGARWAAWADALEAAPGGASSGGAVGGVGAGNDGASGGGVGGKVSARIEETLVARHFFRDGRFHLMGVAPEHRAVVLVHDGSGRLMGVTSVQVPAREWDDTPVRGDFWDAAIVAAPPAEATVSDEAVVTVKPAGSDEAILRQLRENERQRGAQGGIPVTIHGDLTPWVLLAALLLGVPWVLIERREYRAA
ncbi:MAG: BatA domain-containing protein [Planctomycetota bacterium]